VAGSWWTVARNPEADRARPCAASGLRPVGFASRLPPPGRERRGVARNRSGPLPIPQSGVYQRHPWEVRLMRFAACLLTVLVCLSVYAATPAALAGTLEPPGPVAPTMVTLQQIYDKIGPGAGVAKTGQTTCWNASGTVISCAGTGQDGALQKGVSVSPRFTDNLNGTVKDNLTGLIWLKNANCFGIQTWTNALGNSNTLAGGACGLSDGSVAGAWRLPNIKELQSLIDFGRFNSALPVGHPFSGVQLDGYWSSTTDALSPGNAWDVGLGNGDVRSAGKSSTYVVWPVRGGQ